MKIETLLSFQYENAATNYLVRVVEFSDMLTKPGTHWQLTTIDGEIISRSMPASRAEALKVAEIKVSEFVARMHMIYNV